MVDQMEADWPAYVADWTAWRADRLAEGRRLAENSGTHWLDETARSLPGLPGQWSKLGATIVGSFNAAEWPVPDPAADQAAAVSGAISLARGQETELSGRRLTVMARGEHLALRVFDPTAAGAVALIAIATFPPDPAWRIKADFQAAAAGEQLAVDHVDGAHSQADLAGWAVFSAPTTAGQSCRLALTEAGDGYFLVFADASNGRQTKQYRFLKVEPAVDGQVVLDFNRAFLPPISFSPHYLCPLPDPANHLAFPVLAGEIEQVYVDGYQPPAWSDLVVANPYPLADPVIDLARLLELMAVNPDLRLLDVRWQLGVSDNREQYLAGHLPGAVWVDLDTELAAEPTADSGRHPLPTVAAFQAAARRWGINDGDQVVVYDGGGNYAAARAWWLLTAAGLPKVKVLDGAWPAWRDSGQPIASGPVEPTPGQVQLTDFNQLPQINIDQAARWPESGLLLDARASERYRGLTEPVDRKAGHIPGAISAPTGDNLSADGRFLSAEQLRQRWLKRGLDPTRPVASYCGSGVTAAHQVLALRRAGWPAVLYVGSWSQWSQTDRPVETDPVVEPRR
jgi:thiosulfate/3-mercaptopyruvate sulfurtransferase